MAELKTFVFTDIAGSVHLKNEMSGGSDTERDRAFIETILTPHRQRIETDLAAHGGRVVSTAGDGHFLVFGDTVMAARWAVGIQESHRDHPLTTPQGTTVQVRISIHVGIPQVDPQDPNNFVGKSIDYAARLNDYATAGQILVSRSVMAILEDAGMDGIWFHAHGRRELKGIGRVAVHELVYGKDGPHDPRNQPQKTHERRWTVLPATMGLTEFYTAGGTAAAVGAAVTHRQLGNYELGELLGSGGMGNVYKARHTQFGRVRAIKVIKPNFVDSGHEEIIRRFYQEIKATGALEHPNIVVAIESSAPSDRVHYLVMEYIDGVSVDEEIARHGPMAVSDACEIARQAARGLQYIHQHGMVHRDIKPSNLMLALSAGYADASDEGLSGGNTTDTTRAVVKILDLGLALLVSDDEQRLTRFDNRAMGTGMYMAPEQWRTTSVDIRADVYSLGCTLYHMLAGRPPFAESDLRPRRAHERERLPPIDRPKDPVPRKLWAVVKRMTAKLPEDRYATPGEVAAALAPYCGGHGLVALIKADQQPAPDTATRPKVGSETKLAKSAESDTLTGRSGPWRYRLPAPRYVGRQKLRQFARGLAGLVLVGLIVWTAILAGQRWGTSQKTRAQRLSDLQLKANFASRGIADEINRRIEILEAQADRPELRDTIQALDRDPQDNAAWNLLADWIVARKIESDSKAPSESWFVVDRNGKQIARAPDSNSVGRNYAHRDYFHGLGRDRPEPNNSEEIAEIEPIQQPHQSAVYRSTSSGRLKVAFSVPVWNGKPPGPEREVIGVLAMSVDLGAFDVLEQYMTKEHRFEAVLIDLGGYRIEGQSGRGLVLHHQGIDEFEKDGPLPVVGPELLGKIEQALESNETSGNRATFLEDYRDPVVTGGRLYLGALRRVDDQLSTEGRRPIDWVVLVQEPVRSDR